jgi:tetratricopeptide (TPR) repeat protein
VRRFREAHHRAERALRVLDGALGPEHPLIASALNILGIVANAERRFDDGRRLAERAVAMGEKVRKKNDVMIALYHETLGNALAGLRRFGEARAAYERAKTRHVSREGMKLSAARVLTYLGLLMLGEGNGAHAVTTLRESLRIREQERAEATEIAETRLALARALRAAGGADAESRRLAQVALDAYLKAGSAFRNEVAEARTWLGAPRESRER